jgi:hypothetical protein
VTIWEIMFWYSTGPVITLYGRITTSDYVNTLGDQVHPVVHMFPNNDVIFQDDNSPIHTVLVRRV